MLTYYYRICCLLLILVCPVSSACTDQSTCIETNSWQVGVALGVGVKTNPLVDGDPIPLVILPDIAWYGERAYFDNAELGYQWLSQANLAFETFLTIDRERSFFSFLHPSNFVLPVENVGAEAPEPSPAPSEDFDSPQPDFSIDDIASRKWALNGGARLRYFYGQSQIQTSFQTDFSGVHEGQRVDFEYSYKWLWRDIRLRMRMGATWKSDALINYYYGISARDTQLENFHFIGKAGWQPSLSLSLHKPINQKWTWLANLGYRSLPSSLTASPIVSENNVSNVFFGLAYRY